MSLPVISFYVSPRMMKEILSAAAVRGCTSEADYCYQLVQSDVATLKMLAIAEPLPSGPPEKPICVESESRVRSKVDAVTVQKLLHLRQQVTLSDLSRRFQLSPTTIARVFRDYDQAEHTEHNLMGRAGNSKWWQVD